MGWTHLSDSYPKAKKNKYRCSLCGLFIMQGERHCKRVGTSDGDFTSNRMHLECDDMSSAWPAEVWENDPDPADVRRDLIEYRKFKVLIAGRDTGKTAALLYDKQSQEGNSHE